MTLTFLDLLGVLADLSWSHNTLTVPRIKEFDLDMTLGSFDSNLNLPHGSFDLHVFLIGCLPGGVDSDLCRTLFCLTLDLDPPPVWTWTY